MNVPDLEEPYYNLERILRWCKVKHGRKFLKEYLMLWRGYPVEEATWVQADTIQPPKTTEELPRKKITPKRKRCE